MTITAAEVQSPDLSKELIEMARQDQAYRMGWFEYRHDEA